MFWSGGGDWDSAENALDRLHGIADQHQLVEVGVRASVARACLA